MKRVSRGDKARLRALVPAAVGILHAQQRLDAPRNGWIVCVMAQSLQRDQRQRRRRGIELPVGLPGFAAVAASCPGSKPQEPSGF